MVCFSCKKKSDGLGRFGVKRMIDLDVVINCAGRVGGIMANYRFPTEFLFENIKIQMNLVNACFIWLILALIAPLSASI